MPPTLEELPLVSEKQLLGGHSAPHPGDAHACAWDKPQDPQRPRQVRKGQLEERSLALAGSIPPIAPCSLPDVRATGRPQVGVNVAATAPSPHNNPSPARGAASCRQPPPPPPSGRTAPWSGLPHLGPLRGQPLSLPQWQAGHNQRGGVSWK